MPIKKEASTSSHVEVLDKGKIYSVDRKELAVHTSFTAGLAESIGSRAGKKLFNGVIDELESADIRGTRDAIHHSGKAWMMKPDTE